LQDSPYTYAGDQTKVNLAEENSTGVKDETGTRPPRPRCSSRTSRPVRTLQDSPYTYAGDQTKVNLAEENSTGVKDEPAKDKWVALTIKHTDGSALKPRFLADPALSVHQLLHQPLLAGALSVGDDTKFALRVVSSPRRSRLLNNMEKLGDVLAHEQSGRPTWKIWPLRSELVLSVTPLDAGC